jgi:hypothetical protein
MSIVFNKSETLLSLLLLKLTDNVTNCNKMLPEVMATGARPLVNEPPCRPICLTKKTEWRFRMIFMDEAINLCCSIGIV